MEQGFAVSEVSLARIFRSIGEPKAEEIGAQLRGEVDALQDVVNRVAADGYAIESPRCYRGIRQDVGLDLIRHSIGHERLYEITGIQDLPFNTIVQLTAANASRDEALCLATRALVLPDYFHTWLDAEPRSEASVAFTTPMVDALTGG